MARRTQGRLVYRIALRSDRARGRMIALSYINAGILVLASAALCELVISLRRAHERLEALLALRTVSLSEIHHRVKNNLQIVSSLLRLQSSKFNDPAVRGVFTECRDRINAMARLHEQLYDEAGRSHLDFAPHLRELADMLVFSHRLQGDAEGCCGSRSARSRPKYFAEPDFQRITPEPSEARISRPR
jgi:hypothetical protein